MDADGGISRPPSLRQVLDAGCDLREVNVNLEGLAETAFTEVQRLVTDWAWEAELLDDPALAERFREALPEPLVSTYGPQFDQARRPHPIEVHVPPVHWHCNSCGAAYDQGEAHAVTITDRENFSDLDYPIHYCTDCIELASQVAEYAKGWQS